MKRFWEKVNKSGVNKCWNWTASCDGKGYGQFSLNGKNHRAHRIAWEFCEGKIPDKLFVCHKCDNKKCVNPDHLFLGTALSNVQDMDKKGRRISVIRVEERHSMAKLTNFKVKVIKILLRDSKMKQNAIAKYFQVTPDAINHIKKDKLWQNVIV